MHNCLPELNPQDISLSSRFGGILLLSPFLINAVTGGAEAVTEINRRLAQSAKKAGAALAVGSQYGAVKRKTNYYSYEVVREEYPDGVIFANTSALATPEEALEAVKMIDADALQIHLNPAQELIMPEGDREFKGLFANMQRILDKCCVPVIVKETGCGMAARQVKQLLKAGFTCRRRLCWKPAAYAAAKALLQQPAACARGLTQQNAWRWAPMSSAWRAMCWQQPLTTAQTRRQS